MNAGLSHYDTEFIRRCGGEIYMILQCIGAGTEPQPDTTDLLCSGGFRHKITAGETWVCFLPGPDQMKERRRHLTELAKESGERDNITVFAIKEVGETMGERYG